MNSSEERRPTVCVYAASSKACHPDYHDAARRLGVFLAERHFNITYGGGGVGLMGALADGALKSGRTHYRCASQVHERIGMGASRTDGTSPGRGYAHPQT